MVKTFFDESTPKDPVSKKLLEQNKIDARKAHLMKIHKALDQLREEIAIRVEKFHEFSTFLARTQRLYSQLTEEYRRKPSTTLAARRSELKQAINDLLATLAVAQPEKEITDLRAKYNAWVLALAQQEKPSEEGAVSLASPRC